jgi:chromosome segregation ATPase
MTEQSVLTVIDVLGERIKNQNELLGMNERALKDNDRYISELVAKESGHLKRIAELEEELKTVNEWKRVYKNNRDNERVNNRALKKEVESWKEEAKQWEKLANELKKNLEEKERNLYGIGRNEK